MAIFRQGIQIKTFNFAEVEARLGAIDPKLRKAVERAIKRTVEYTQKEIPRQVIKRYDISESSLMDTSRRAKFSMKPVYKREKGKIAGAKVDVQGSRLPVMRFRVVPQSVPNQRGIKVMDRQPVTISIVKGQTVTAMPNRFLARMQSGHVGLYKRKTPNPGGPRRIRPDGQPTQLPISEAHMLSVPEMISGKEIRPKITRNVNRNFRKYLNEEIIKEGVQLAGTIAEFL